MQEDLCTQSIIELDAPYSSKLSSMATTWMYTPINIYLNVAGANIVPIDVFLRRVVVVDLQVQPGEEYTILGSHSPAEMRKETRSRRGCVAASAGTSE